MIIALHITTNSGLIFRNEKNCDLFNYPQILRKVNIVNQQQQQQHRHQQQNKHCISCRNIRGEDFKNIK